MAPAFARFLRKRVSRCFCNPPPKNRADGLCMKSVGPKIASPKGSAQVTRQVTAGYFGDLAVTAGLRLTATLQGRQAAAVVAFGVLVGGARNNRSSVRGGNLRSGGREVRAHNAKHQDRNPECLLHGLSPVRALMHQKLCLRAWTRIIRHASSPSARFPIHHRTGWSVKPALGTETPILFRPQL